MYAPPQLVLRDVVPCDTSGAASATRLERFRPPKDSHASPSTIAGTRRSSVRREKVALTWSLLTGGTATTCVSSCCVHPFVQRSHQIGDIYDHQTCWHAIWFNYPAQTDHGIGLLSSYLTQNTCMVPPDEYLRDSTRECTRDKTHSKDPSECRAVHQL